MADTEHYVDPEDRKHEKFAEVRDVPLALLDRHLQASCRTEITTMTVGEAVEKGVIANETFGYFLARVQMFLLKIGINPERLRFRQHMPSIADLLF